MPNSVFPEKKQCSPEAIVDGGDDDVGDTHRPVVAEKSLATTTERQRADDGGDTHRPVVTDLSLATTTEPKCSSGRKRVRHDKDNGNLVDENVVDSKDMEIGTHDREVTEKLTKDREDSLEKEAFQKLRADLIHERRQHMRWLFTHVKQMRDLVSNTTERFKTLASKPNNALENQLKDLKIRLEGIPDNENETIVETVFIKDYDDVDGDRESLSNKDVWDVIEQEGMVSDATLHFYSGLLTERDYARCRELGGKRSAIFSCHFIQFLLMEPAQNEINYQLVESFRKLVPGKNPI
jgi:hypothetical protein